MKNTLTFVFLSIILALNLNSQSVKSTGLSATVISGKSIVSSELAPKPIGPYSQAVMINDMLFVSGQIALDFKTGKIIEGDIQKEAETVMQYLKAVIGEAGFSMSDIVKTSIFLTDIKDFQTVNQVYASFFISEFPARETVQVAALPKGARVEISCICAKSKPLIQEIPVGGIER